MKSTLKILFQLLHTGEHDPVSAEGLENLIHPYFDALKIIYNKHKSDRINLDFNVKFYEVIKKEKIKFLKKTCLLGQFPQHRTKNK